MIMEVGNFTISRVRLHTRDQGKMMLQYQSQHCQLENSVLLRAGSLLLSYSRLQFIDEVPLHFGGQSALVKGH